MSDGLQSVDFLNPVWMNLDSRATDAAGSCDHNKEQYRVSIIVMNVADKVQLEVGGGGLISHTTELRVYVDYQPQGKIYRSKDIMI